MVTPFDKEGQVDYGQAQRLALALLDSGSDGVVVAGTTGEAPTLSQEEKLKLFAEVKRAVDGRGPVIARTGTHTPAQRVAFSREPARTGVHGHSEAIARGAPLPGILYNLPGRTGVTMTAETTLRLSRIPNIVGVKEASGDLLQIARIIADARDGFRVWSGDDQMTLPILAVGGYGAICVVSHLIGAQMHDMIDSLLAGRVEQAAAIHRGLLPLMTTLMTAASNPIPIKHALNGIGFQVGAPRLPLVEPDQGAAERIMAEVRRHRIDLAVAV